MRVLHVVTDMRIANGIMSVVLNYFKAMPDDIKFDIAYFCDFPENRKADVEALGGRVFKLSRPGPKSFIKSDWDAFFKEHGRDFEAVHIHAPHLACFIAPKVRKYGIKKIAVHCHSTWYSLFKKNRFRNFLLSIPAKYMDAARMACGEEAGKFWFGENNFKVVPNAIDCEKLKFDDNVRNDKRRELSLDGKFVIGNVGRVKPVQKNQIFLIPVLKEVLKTKENACLMLVGAEPDEELTAAAREYGVEDRVMFLGQRTDVKELLTAMDVFAFPSLYEGLPVAVVEAQAAGIAVVMSDRVTKEVCCTDRITCCSLDESAEHWAKTILEYGKKGPVDTSAVMKRSGWDIKESGQILESFYRNGAWER